MSWLADDEPRHKQRKVKKPGRPKKEGGPYHRINISVDDFIKKALEKVDNTSEFLRDIARPVLEKMDPGDACVFLWRIDVLLSEGIIEATKERDFKQVIALSWLANCLEDARRLCGVPPPDFHLPSTEKPARARIGLAAAAFGSYPGHPRWNPIADINQDNKVDMRDIVTVARNFGKTA